MSEFHVDVGAYALDALDEAERAAFEEHLAGCEDCRRELAEFLETAARLGALAEVPPPVELRGSVLGAIGQVRPLPPEDVPPPSAAAASGAAAPTTRPNRPGPRRAMASSGDTAPGWGPAPDGPAETGGPRRSADAGPLPGGQIVEVDELAARRLQRRSRLLTLAVAAATVIALALGGWTYVLHRDQQVAAANAAAATRLLSAPDVRTYSVRVDGTPATFVVSKSLDQAMFVGADVPVAPARRTYQLWTLDADQHPTPDAMFAGGPDTRTFMTGDIRDAAYLAVSNEPAGGSEQPTLPVLAATKL